MSAPAIFSQILGRGVPGCRVIQVSELGGGVSARAALVDVELADATARRVVVRRPQLESAAATRQALHAENALLGFCQRFGVPAPVPCFVDDAHGAIVVEYLEGEVDLSFSDLASKLSQMANALRDIHRLPVTSELGFLELRSESAARDILEPPAELDASLNEAELRARLAVLWPWPEHHPNVLLHGDYWPGNLLWRATDGGARLAAVLDWEEAQLGDPLSDLAIARLDVLWAFGEAAMHDFTEHYRRAGAGRGGASSLEWSTLPHWDLWAALRPMSRLARWAPAYATAALRRPDVTELSMREGHRRFVEQALERLK